MRTILGLKVALLLVLLAVTYGEAGLVQRHNRHVESSDQIPVAVIEVQEPEVIVQALQADTDIQTTDNSADNEPSLTEYTLKSSQAERTEVPAAEEAQTELELNKIIVAKGKQADELKDKLVLEETTDLKAVVTEAAELPLDGSPAEAGLAAVRQATQVVSTTPQNLVQFIQSSPIGQFFSQITGGQQQQQPDRPANDQTGAPTPTVPGFLNPAVALTQAQQAVQNAAQSVVNSTTQAFQGLQQFASNIGTQFQSTLSNLGGQNQLSSAESTSARPPGPIQAFVSNLVGGNQAATTTAPQQQPGPLQGIISFFQGGNRPQSNSAAAAATNAQQVNNPSNDPPKNEANPTTSIIDDKIEVQTQEAEATNEVRHSEEVVEDSFEETQPEQLIVVNDDAAN